MRRERPDFDNFNMKLSTRKYDPCDYSKELFGSIIVGLIVNFVVLLIVV